MYVINYRRPAGHFTKFYNLIRGRVGGLNKMGWSLPIVTLDGCGG